MPNLHSLSVSVHQTNDDWANPSMLLYTPVTDQFPRLRCLSLCQVHMPWNIPMLASLVYLELRNIHPLGAPMFEQMLQILERCPDLEVLTLDGCDISFTLTNHTDPTEPRRLVSLPALKTLTLCGVLTESSQLLACLKVPSTAAIWLRTFAASHETPLLSTWVLQDERALQYFCPFRAFEIDIKSLCVTLDAYDDDVFLSFPRFSILSTRATMVDVGHTLRDTATLFSGAAITVLGITNDCDYELTSAGWRGFLGRFPSVRDLRVKAGHSSVLELLDVLGRAPGADGNEDVTVGPQLSRLKVCIPNLPSRFGESVGAQDCESLGHAVLSALQSRGQRGLPALFDLEICFGAVGPQLSEQMTGSLSAMVGEFTQRGCMPMDSTGNDSELTDDDDEMLESD
ncbi:hypothetical protein B0H21DRAFT_763391 [Amylocystis lapponica]|nr:hypothetical protein B0H21DRAFT_763391 [Amylocystis lapponica]